MIVYSMPFQVDDAELMFMGMPEELGGKVLEGSPKITVRIDFQSNNMTAGVFAVTAGKVEVQFPFTEHATILEGSVTLTDEAGRSHTYYPGDSYFIRQGQVIIWEVTGERVVKAFFNFIEPRDSYST